MGRVQNGIGSRSSQRHARFCQRQCAAEIESSGPQFDDLIARTVRNGIINLRRSRAGVERCKDCRPVRDSTRNAHCLTQHPVNPATGWNNFRRTDVDLSR